MRVFIMQIHNRNNGVMMDQIIIRETFEKICEDFSRKFEFLKKNGIGVEYIEEPTLDECTNEVHGEFVVRQDVCTKIHAKVYDYDI